MRKITYLIISSSLVLQFTPPVTALAAFHAALQSKREEAKQDLQQKRDTLKQEVKERRDALKDDLQQKRDTIKGEPREKRDVFTQEAREKRDAMMQEFKKRQEVFHEQVKEKRDVLHNELKEKREKFMAEMKERKEGLKKKLGEKRAERVEQFFQQMVEKFKNAIERFKNFTDRIAERLNKAEENGKDISELRAKLALANEKILEAEKALEDAKTKYSEAVKEPDFKVAFQRVKEIVRGVTEKVKAAHRALVEVVSSLKGLGRGAADQERPTGEKSRERNVEITSAGFAPAELEVKIGTTVHFTNRDSQLHWPASGVHPAHDLCPGFDSLKGLSTGESYSFTFNEAKTCPMHDHLNPALRGKIEVE